MRAEGGLMAPPDPHSPAASHTSGRASRLAEARRFRTRAMTLAMPAPKRMIAVGSGTLVEMCTTSPNRWPCMARPVRARRDPQESPATSSAELV